MPRNILRGSQSLDAKDKKLGAGVLPIVDLLRFGRNLRTNSTICSRCHSNQTTAVSQPSQTSGLGDKRCPELIDHRYT